MKYLSALFICLILVGGSLHAATDSIVFNPAAPAVAMRSYFSITEDKSGTFTPDSLFNNTGLFSNGKDFKATAPNSAFWLFTRIKTLQKANATISFKHLTNCDLYIKPDTPGAVYLHHRAGAFTPAAELSPGDSRFHFQIALDSGTSYLLLIRSRHTKKYQPVFDFELDDLHRFTKRKQQRERIDFWFQGAAFLLLLYVLINWFATRYRPYIWLAIFISGLILYNLALSRYFVDWFFPSHPSTGWRFTIHFLHIGIAGLFLLALDFWKIKERKHALYRLGKTVLYCILVISLLSFLINYYTANFKIMSQFNGCFLIVQVAYLVRLLLLWKSFDSQERLLGYGIILYLIVAFAVTLALFIVGEAVFSLFSILSGSLLVIVSLLFLTGINAKLWQYEKDKALYLAELNQLQQHQNQLLEAGVAERTLELSRRNERIELLMNELNHRVKNNLQLLYSLNSLQLSAGKDAQTAGILKDNVSRIKAMMLVNDSLNLGNKSGNIKIAPADFIADIAAHSQRMFNRAVPVDISLNIEKALILDAAGGLCLGLIVTELLTNSCKHAFADNIQPKITIEMRNTGEHWQMQYRDNGKGIGITTSQSFGLTLIADLTRQLKGRYDLQNNNGVHYLFIFPNSA